MAISNPVTNLMNETAWQQALDAQAERIASYGEGTTRQVGGTMGKNDFLMLLSAQLRYQDPLNPQSDSEFAAQLAQFSSLEQMQNMNETLAAMASYQAYGLVGKYVIAEAVVDGVMSTIPGKVDSIFTRKGVTYAQIGDYDVPIASITDIFDSSSQLTPETLIQTANSLIGRTVMAQVGPSVLEGVVTRVTVDKGIMYAQIDDGSNVAKYVPVNGIFDIKQTGTPGNTPPVTPPTTPPDPPVVPDGNSLTADEDGFIETDDEGKTLGRWDWDAVNGEWVFTAAKAPEPEEP